MTGLKKMCVVVFLCIVSLVYSGDYDELFIENLKNYPLNDGKLTIEYKAGDYKGYKSFVASYKSDNLKLYTLLNIPDTGKKTYPVVIVNHGYIPPQEYSTIKSYRLISTYFAQNGFIVLKPDYRGHDKSEILVNDEMQRLYYPVDVLNVLNTVRSVKNADVNNIFLFGHSMGGGVTLTVLEVMKTIRAASLWAAVSIEYPESSLYFMRKRNSESATQIREKLDLMFSEIDYKKLSFTDYFSEISAPVIIHHGTLDDSCPYQWSVDLHDRLIKNNVKSVFHSYVDDHNFAKKYFYTVLKRDVDFFKAAIK